MSLGSPEHLEDMEDYLLQVRHGRKPSPEFVEEIKRRYRAGGGKSPLLEITQRQAQALEIALNQNGKLFKTYVGMKYWHPYIKNIVEQISMDGIKQLVALPLTPYASKLSLDSYHQAVRASVQLLASPMDVVYTQSWHHHPLLIETFARHLMEGFKKFNGIPPQEVMVLFTAHSLPERILAENDPYPSQLQETVRFVAENAEISRWDFAYQSQGGSAEPWLGPKVEDKLSEFANKGVKQVLVAPIGFVSDHMEIFYDIDVLFKGLAQDQGMHLERTDSLNDDPRFIQVLASVIQNSLRKPE